MKRCWPWRIRKGTVSFLISNNFSYLTYILFYPWKKTVEVGRWARAQLAILLQAAAVSCGLILTESQYAFVIETSHFTFRISYPVRSEHLLWWPSEWSSSLCKTTFSCACTSLLTVSSQQKTLVSNPQSYSKTSQIMCRFLIHMALLIAKYFYSKSIPFQ